MRAESIEGSKSEALARTKQVFRFLKAFAERNAPVRRALAEQPWTLRLADLPDYPTITVGSVESASAPASEAEPPSDGVPPALLAVRRPELTKAPSPPERLTDWISLGWQEVDGTIVTVEQRDRVERDGKTTPERFEDAPERLRLVESWRAEWETWQAAERPARLAAKIFDRLYELRNRIELESERIELMVGDGRVRWLRPDGVIDHPVLLQRVELVFDPVIPEFRIVDADRSPELFIAILHGAEGLSGDRIVELQKELEAGDFHPMARDGTSAFLKRLPLLLARDGRWSEKPVEANPDSAPVVCRDAVLFLRDRASGLPAAFDRVLDHLEQEPELPRSLTRLVGVEPPPPPPDDRQPAPAWSEPEDVLLSKPANAEQVQLARALERHRAVLVQGPPGTGKSHTIANLIGHLVAQGKRVLVTAHTTKALRVLRDKVVEPLQPLCVAVLENDLDSRSQLEQAVRGIVTRLSTANGKSLDAEIERWSATRATLLGEIDRLAGELSRARAGEYLPVTFGSEAVPPSEAAAEIARGGDQHQWLPGALEPGAPLPLSIDEIDELYLTNASLEAAEDAELADALPSSEQLLSPSEFALEVASLSAAETPEQAAYWNAGATASAGPALQHVRDSLATMLRELDGMETWQAAVVEAGFTGITEAELWTGLAARVRKTVETHHRHRELLVECSPEIVDGEVDAGLVSAITEIREHLAAGGSLNRLRLFTNGTWRRAIARCRVNGGTPSTLPHFRALAGFIELDTQRRDLAQRWNRQIAAYGMPRFEELAAPGELTARGWAAQFDRLLAWWNDGHDRLRHALRDLGFRWQAWHDRASAKAVRSSPFQRESMLLRESLRPVVEVRALIARKLNAENRLGDLARTLASFRGDVCSSLRVAVERRDVAAYQEATARLDALAAKMALRARREELLERLRAAAPSWAHAIQKRKAPHDGPQVPGDPEHAWRWRQLLEEIERRSVFDEADTARRLEAARRQLRDATATLIDRKAWLAQMRRTDLRAQQALYGWLDTQRAIGKGTGRRVPELRAQSRKLLSTARDAVPVWIMPLSRVAESFDPARGIFDVVIVDEASQSDVTGLLAWYLGRQVAIVGDHEQVSPLAVGDTIESASALISEHLAGIPNSHLYDGKTSIYDLARHSFGGVVGLREHFRCVPDIIDFSNYLSYEGQIRPLRNPGSALQPHVAEVVVPAQLATGRDDKTNIGEARLIAALVRATCDDGEFAGRSLGAITLLGDQQATLIQEMVVSLVGAVEIVRRRFVAGNAAQFQGDERDIIWLSMVDVPGDKPLRFSESPAMKQRYNVAASRAKDRLWLVHSLDPARDLRPGDLRRRLIEHVRNPGARRRALQAALTRAESSFETEVIRMLTGKGFNITSQVEAGHYHIDLVATEGSNQVAIECDGDRFHPFDQIGEDMARQAILERAGWRFVRIRGTRFFRDPERTIDGVCERLERMGVRPVSTQASPPTSATDEVKQRLMPRVWEILRSQGWLQADSKPQRESIELQGASTQSLSPQA